MDFLKNLFQSDDNNSDTVKSDKDLSLQELIERHNNKHAIPSKKVTLETLKSNAKIIENKKYSANTVLSEEFMNKSFSDGKLLEIEKFYINHRKAFYELAQTILSIAISYKNQLDGNQIRKENIDIREFNNAFDKENIAINDESINLITEIGSVTASEYIMLLKKDKYDSKKLTELLKLMIQIIKNIVEKISETRLQQEKLQSASQNNKIFDARDLINNQIYEELINREIANYSIDLYTHKKEIFYEIANLFLSEGLKISNFIFGSDEEIEKSDPKSIHNLCAKYELPFTTNNNNAIVEILKIIGSLIEGGIKEKSTQANTELFIKLYSETANSIMEYYNTQESDNKNKNENNANETKQFTVNNSNIKEYNLRKIITDELVTNLEERNLMDSSITLYQDCDDAFFDIANLFLNEILHIVAEITNNEKESSNNLNKILSIIQEYELNINTATLKSIGEISLILASLFIPTFQEIIGEKFGDELIKKYDSRTKLLISELSREVLTSNNDSKKYDARNLIPKEKFEQKIKEKLVNHSIDLFYNHNDAFYDIANMFIKPALKIKALLTGESKEEFEVNTKEIWTILKKYNIPQNEVSAQAVFDISKIIGAIISTELFQIGGMKLAMEFADIYNKLALQFCSLSINEKNKDNETNDDNGNLILSDNENLNKITLKLSSEIFEHHKEDEAVIEFTKKNELNEKAIHAFIQNTAHICFMILSKEDYFKDGFFKDSSSQANLITKYSLNKFSEMINSLFMRTLYVIAKSTLTQKSIYISNEEVSEFINNRYSVYISFMEVVFLSKE